jgi:hypothetical protein
MMAVFMTAGKNRLSIRYLMVKSATAWGMAKKRRGCSRPVLSRRKPFMGKARSQSIKRENRRTAGKEFIAMRQFLS